MTNERKQSMQLDEPTQTAVEELKGLILHRFPAASFILARGDDPEGVYLRAVVDIEDVDEVVDQSLLDQLFEIQVGQGLPVYVIPLQPIERALSLRKREASQRPVPRVSLPSA